MFELMGTTGLKQVECIMVQRLNSSVTDAIINNFEAQSIETVVDKELKQFTEGIHFHKLEEVSLIDCF